MARPTKKLPTSVTSFEALATKFLAWCGKIRVKEFHETGHVLRIHVQRRFGLCMYHVWVGLYQCECGENFRLPTTP